MKTFLTRRSGTMKFMTRFFSSFGPGNGTDPFGGKVDFVPKIIVPNRFHQDMRAPLDILIQFAQSIVKILVSRVKLLLTREEEINNWVPSAWHELICPFSLKLMTLHQ